MKRNAVIKIIGVALLAVCVASATASAQQITGTPGSPSATITIDGKQLPAPPQKFKGVIKDTADKSKPYWPARIMPPKGAPNVLLIMTDDSGYGVPSTFGGVIPTPALDKIAKAGLRYTNFHSTALCSPTRAALITGRNHHSVGFGVISEAATGYPGYDSFIEKDTATIGKILKDNGYRTSWFGKNHNTPAFQASADGPFDQWPIGMGFEYFFGFMGGDTNQWQPSNLARNTTYIYPFVGNPNYNLTTDMADEAIAYMNRINTLAPEQPFFVYYVPGGVHAPHHATPEWIKKISDMHLFDEGWNKLRETIFANQQKLGVIPANAKLTPWPKDLLKEWDQLTPDEKKLYIRQVDVFAAYVAYTDHEIGRVIQAVEDMGRFDNTLIIYINGDNGTSSEGQLNGSPNEVAMFNSVQLPVEAQLKYFYDVWGSDKTYNHMAVPWAWAFDTPFYLGQTDRLPLRRHSRRAWRSRGRRAIKDAGGIRNQFHHVIDIVPTILEAAKIKQPTVVDGIKQSPIEGVSMMYTFDRKNANAPVDPQDPVLRDDGRPRDLPRRLDRQHQGHACAVGHGYQRRRSKDPTKFPWELYDLRNDWTQTEDLAAKKYPAKLKETAGAILEGGEEVPGLAARHLGGRANDHAAAQPHGRPQCVHLDAAAHQHANGDAPSILNTSYNFRADIEIPQGGAEGMLITQGGRFGGYGFYVLKNKPVFLWNLVDLKRVRWEGPRVGARQAHARVRFQIRRTRGRHDGLRQLRRHSERAV